MSYVLFFPGKQEGMLLIFTALNMHGSVSALFTETLQQS